MIQPKLSSQQIYQHLISVGFELESDKVLRQPWTNPELVWTIIVFMVNRVNPSEQDEKIENTIFQALQGEEVDPGVFQRANQYIKVSETLHLISKTIDDDENEDENENQNQKEEEEEEKDDDEEDIQNYQFLQIIKPERQQLLEKLSMLVHADNFIKEAEEEEKEDIKKLLQTQEQQENKKKKTAQNYRQIEELTLIQQRQKAQVDEKTIILDNLNNDFNYKKKEKSDLIASQQQLQDQLQNKLKQVAQMKLFNEGIKNEKKQLQKERIQNAPLLIQQKQAAQQECLEAQKEEEAAKDKMDEKWEIIQKVFEQIGNLREISPIVQIKKLLKETDQEEAELELQEIETTEVQNQLEADHQTKMNLMKKLQQFEITRKQAKQISDFDDKQEEQMEIQGKQLQEEQNVRSIGVEALEKNMQLCLSQYTSLESKILYQRQKFFKRIQQLNYHFRQSKIQASQIIKNAFKGLID